MHQSLLIFSNIVSTIKCMYHSIKYWRGWLHATEFRVHNALTAEEWRACLYASYDWNIGGLYPRAGGGGALAPSAPLATPMLMFSHQHGTSQSVILHEVTSFTRACLFLCLWPMKWGHNFCFHQNLGMLTFLWFHEGIKGHCICCNRECFNNYIVQTNGTKYPVSYYWKLHVCG